MRCRALLLAISTLFFPAIASVTACAQARCPDAADDPHFSVLFQNSRARVLALDLGRLERTKPYCNKSAYLSIVTTASRTTSIAEGMAGITHDWKPGEARFHYRPMQQQTIRNETSAEHREIVIETLLPVQFNPLDGSYDTDEFGSDLNTVKPTWSTSFSRGALFATKIQLAAGDSFQLSGADHVLIALTDLVLTSDAHRTIRLDKQDATVLRTGGPNKLTNTDNAPARFIVVDF